MLPSISLSIPEANEVHKVKNVLQTEQNFPSMLIKHFVTKDLHWTSSQSTASQPTSQSASQPVIQSFIQPASQSASYLVSQLSSQPVSQSDSRAASQTVGQPVSQAVG
jgi:hypothetical protein